MMINLYDTDNLLQSLSRLQAGSLPAFGKMSAQHMVEHLTLLIMISTGKLPQKLVTPEEKLPALKRFLYSTKKLPVGVKAPMLPEKPLPLVHANLDSAINALRNELLEFFEYYRRNPEARQIHPVFGKLNYNDWLMFHTKHFAHHFRQFGLIDFMA